MGSLDVEASPNTEREVMREAPPASILGPSTRRLGAFLNGAGTLDDRANDLLEY